ncbi:MAG: histidine phosphatase family protein [Gammaproteobacteria bacterium]|nr:histidine phosphatase family protein [Gammaproteobacteria bacterium]
MSHTLLIFRHAKSGMDAPSDHERTLTKHGIQQAKFMGELLNEKDIHPDLVVCSSASRAVETMNLAMMAGQWECDSTVTDALYNTTVNVLFELFKHLSENDKVVMLVGHEPTWSELANSLTGETLTFNTAGLCCISFDIEQWKDLKPGSGMLEWYESP